MGKPGIYNKKRHPRLITVRRGGALSEASHHLLALWAASCAEHVLPLFEQAQPADQRPRQAIAQGRAWASGQASIAQARTAASAAHAAARAVGGAAKEAARSAGQAAAVAHMADHALGAAAYAIRAARAAAPQSQRQAAGYRERQWQREQLPDSLRTLVLDDQRLRSAKFWSLFDDQPLELGFGVRMQFQPGLTPQQVSAFADRFLAELVEPNGMAYGGWEEGYMTRYTSGSLSEADREKVRAWLEAAPEVLACAVLPLTCSTTEDGSSPGSNCQPAGCGS